MKCTAVNENGHMFCEQCKQSWPLNDPDPKPCQLASRDEKEWCRYIAGLICTYLNDGSHENAITGIIERRTWNLSRSTHRDAQPSVAQGEAVAYLDLGVGGYIDVGSDLTDEQLAALPKGRHMLAIVGTYGVDGYAEAPAVAVNEQILKDALRYRWLRNPHQDVSLVIDKRTKWVPEDESVQGVGGYWIYEYRSGEDLDSAIDSAIAAAEAERNKGGV